MPFVGSEWFWEVAPKRFHNDRLSTASDYDWGPDFNDVKHHFINDIEYDIGDSFSDAQVQESKPPTFSTRKPRSSMSYFGKRASDGLLELLDSRPSKKRRITDYFFPPRYRPYGKVYPQWQRPRWRKRRSYFKRRRRYRRY